MKMIEQEGEPKSTTRKEKGRQKHKTTRNSAWLLSKDAKFHPPRKDLYICNKDMRVDKNELE